MKFKAVLFFIVVMIQAQAHASFEGLPDPVKLLVLSNTDLEARDLCHCAIVSEKMRTLADSDQAWRHLFPEHKASLLRLLLEECPSVKALSEAGIKPSPSVLSFKLQCRIYAIMPLHKELIEKEICRVALKVYTNFIPIFSTQEMEELYLFAEPYGSRWLSSYIGNIEDEFLDKIKGAEDAEDRANYFRSMRQIHNRFIK